MKLPPAPATPDSSETPPHFFYRTGKLLQRWTFSAAIGGYAGYYSLGWAYEKGVMREIDRYAIKLLKPQVGRVGIGLWMPTIQRNSAYAVQCIVAMGVTTACQIGLRIAEAVWVYLQPKPPLPPPPQHPQKTIAAANDKKQNATSDL